MRRIDSKLRLLSVLAVAIAGITYILPPNAVLAATADSSVLTTSPIYADLSATPGTPISTTLQVQNNSTKPVIVSLKLEEFKANGVHGQAQIYNPPVTDPSLHWVSFSQNNFTAQPNVFTPVKMTVSLPKTADVGYYYAVIVSPSETVQGAKNAVKGENAIFILVDGTGGKGDRKLSVKSFTASKGVYEYLPATFNVEVSNPGDIYLVPEGDIFISRTANGPTIDSLQINASAGNVLPHSNRVFSATWSDGLPKYQVKRVAGQIVSNKKGVPEKHLVWDFSNSLGKFRFGKYYAHLTLVYNDGVTDVPVTSIISFWVIPWPLIFIAILILIPILLGIFIMIRSLFRRAKKLKK